MARRKLNLRNKYHRQGCTPMYKCFKNHVNIGANTTLKHALAVTAICWNLKKLGHDFITEAVPNKNSKRRIDIVDLTTGQEIEVEATGKFKKGTKNFKVLTEEEYLKLKNEKTKL